MQYSNIRHLKHITVDDRDLPRLLEAGNRMDCPTQCSKDVFRVMTECWSALPTSRPVCGLLQNIYSTVLEFDILQTFEEIGNMLAAIQVDEKEPTIRGKKYG